MSIPADGEMPRFKGQQVVGIPTSDPYGGVHTGGLHTGNLSQEPLGPLPRPKFPEVGRIPKSLFDVGFSPRVTTPFPVGDFLVTQPVNGKVLTQRGWVLCIEPKSGASPMMHYRVPPEIDHDLPTKFSVADKKSLVVIVETDEKDVVTSVSAVIEDTDTVSIHAQPPPTAAGEEPPPPLTGKYHYRIADFVMDGSFLITKQIHSGGAIVHRPSLPEFYNIPSSEGTKYDIFKKWNAVDSRFELRPIVQLYDSFEASAVVLPFQEGEPPYDSIKIRSLRPREDDPQIRVRTPGGDTDTAITIEGNGVDGYAAINSGGNITCVDGLITAITEGTLGQNLDITVECASLAHDGADPSYVTGLGPFSYYNFYFRNGLYIGTAAPLGPPGDAMRVSWITS